MKTSWTKTFRRLAAGCAVAGSTALSSAACYAAIAFDSASDPVYADGWQDGDNGGSGFTAWNFDARYNGFGQYLTPGFKAIDDGLQSGTPLSSTFNNIGRAWTQGATPTDDGGNHVGRGFSLGIGETLKVTIDNPTARQFFKGYFVRLNGGTGGVDGNICPGAGGTSVSCSPGGTPSPKLNIGTFEYGTNGAWFVDDAVNSNPGMQDTDTAAAGAVINVKRTGAETYDLLFATLDGNKQFASANRTFDSPGANVDWIEFVFFNTVPTVPPTATNFYISSMMIVPEPGTATLFVLGAGGLLGVASARRRSKEQD
jgi:PEP-CTERM motif